MHKTDGRKEKTQNEPLHNYLFKAILYTDRNKSTIVCYMILMGEKETKENP